MKNKNTDIAEIDVENHIGFKIISNFKLPETMYKIEYRNKYDLDKILVGDSILADDKSFVLLRASASNYKKANNRFNYKSIRLTRKIYCIYRIPVDRNTATEIRNNINVLALKEDYLLLDKNKHTLALYYGVSDRTIGRMLSENNIS